jgi:hypothetical protein
VLAKYPVAACGGPLLLLLVVLRGRRARMDVAVFVAIVTAVLGSYYLAERPQLVGFLHWRTANNPNFGVTPTIVAALQAWYGALPLALGLGGWLVCRRKAVGSALLLGALVFPAYHLASANGVGDSKHAVYGALFTLPLGGLLLSRLPRDAAGRMLLGAIVVAVGAFGVAQAWRLDHSWIDVDPATRYLTDHARPGQHFLIDDSWPFGQRLYAAGKVGNPRDVVDPYRLTHERVDRPLCRYDWFVAAQGAGQWSPALRDQVAACGTYRRVFASRARVVVLGADLRFVSLTARAEVFRNIGVRRRVRR